MTISHNFWQVCALLHIKRSSSNQVIWFEFDFDSSRVEIDWNLTQIQVKFQSKIWQVESSFKIEFETWLDDQFSSKISNILKSSYVCVTTST